MNLSPFDMKNLLHHILSGKEFGVERSGESVLQVPQGNGLLNVPIGISTGGWSIMNLGLCGSLFRWDNRGLGL
jgi:hypothetical protein